MIETSWEDIDIENITLVQEEEIQEEENEQEEKENVVVYEKLPKSVKSVVVGRPKLSYREHCKHLKIASSRIRKAKTNGTDIEIERMENEILGIHRADNWHDRIREDQEMKRKTRMEKIKRESEYVSKKTCKIEVVSFSKPKIVIEKPTMVWDSSSKKDDIIAKNIQTEIQKTIKPIMLTNPIEKPFEVPRKPKLHRNSHTKTKVKFVSDSPHIPRVQARKLCKYYKYCRNEKCNFAHVLEDTMICNFNTRCTNPKCTFRHSEDSLETLYKRIYN